MFYICFDFLRNCLIILFVVISGVCLYLLASPEIFHLTCLTSVSLLNSSTTPEVGEQWIMKHTTAGALPPRRESEITFKSGQSKELLFRVQSHA